MVESAPRLGGQPEVPQTVVVMLPPLEERLARLPELLVPAVASRLLDLG